MEDALAAAAAQTAGNLTSLSRRSPPFSQIGVEGSAQTLKLCSREHSFETGPVSTANVCVGGRNLVFVRV